MDVTALAADVLTDKLRHYYVEDVCCVSSSLPDSRDSEHVYGYLVIPPSAAEYTGVDYHNLRALMPIRVNAGAK